jgi:predicted Zn-dependent peptidase
MAEQIKKHQLSNGMTILGTERKDIGSAAFMVMVPAGASYLPEGCDGASNVILDWIFRGAGDMDSRQLSNKLDSLGTHRNSDVGSSHLVLGAALEAGKLVEALEIYSDIVQKPRCDKEQFDLSRQLAIHEVMGLDDDPRHKVMLELRKRYYPYPLGRSPLGDKDQLEKLEADTAAKIVKNNFDISDSILTVSGKVDFEEVCKKAESLFGKAKSTNSQEIKPGAQDKYEYIHIPYEGSQVHIGLMTNAVPKGDDKYYDLRTAVSILSGGMSSRLFTNVREKRGLCYAVGARYHDLKGHAGIACYAGTTADKAQETIDVIVDEFDKLNEGISDDEMARAKIGLKSGLIMEAESSSTRAVQLGQDYHLLGRVRTIEEIKNAIDSVSKESVRDSLQANSFNRYTVVTIGPKEIKFNR